MRCEVNLSLSGGVNKEKRAMTSADWRAVAAPLKISCGKRENFVEKLFPSRSLFKNLKCLIIITLWMGLAGCLYSSQSTRDIEKFVPNPGNFHFHRWNADVFPCELKELRLLKSEWENEWIALSLSAAEPWNGGIGCRPQFSLLLIVVVALWELSLSSHNRNLSAVCSLPPTPLNAKTVAERILSRNVKHIL